MSDERRAEIEAGLAEEVTWAINYLRGIQREINDLHRDGRLKAWDRSRLHDLIRCVVDGVQGRVGLERALRGEVSTTAERSASALDGLRDARGDDEAATGDDEYGECGVLNPGWQKGVPARSPQGEDHEDHRSAVERDPASAARHIVWLEGERDHLQDEIARLTSAQGEDYEAGIEAALKVAHEGPLNACNMGSDMCETRPEVRRVIAAYLSGVSAPKDTGEASRDAG